MHLAVLILVRQFKLAHIAFLCALLFVVGCDRSSQTDSNKRLRLATTTSTRDSGLLALLIPVFESQTNCKVDVIAVGTGAALKLGEAGDADVLIVHAPAAEQQFVKSGHAGDRETFMFNHFVVVGPPEKVSKFPESTALNALRVIAENHHPFISRGDDSGTHKKELQLWDELGVIPSWSEYQEGGSGMGATLTIASEKQAFTLADKGTFLRFQEKVDLVMVGSTSEVMRNPYSVITVNPKKNQHIDGDLAKRFAEFVGSEQSKTLIDNFRVDGEKLFQSI